MSDPRSQIPSIDALLASPGAERLLEDTGRSQLADAFRDAVVKMRRAIEREDIEIVELVDDLKWYTEHAAQVLIRARIPGLRRVINSTGVVLHTNLGRAPLADEALQAMRHAATYSNLEFNLHEGVRGSRYTHCVDLLCELTGAEDALVSNNAAGALVLAISTVGLGKSVAVSRGELVEIGGGFRIPDVLERSGASLVEVGSTNRTRSADYESAAARGEVTAILKVHRSNFRITGFTEEVSVSQLVSIGESHGIPVVHDLGSGLMLRGAKLDLPDEPMASDSIAAGADAVVVSGDKLLGGPQAGIIVGRREMIERMRRNPLCRALRVDKVTLAGLEATLRLYRDPVSVIERIPTLRMLALKPEALKETAETLASHLKIAKVPCEVVPTKGAVGGGTYPGVELDSWAVELTWPHGAGILSDALRAGDTPVVGRIIDEKLRLDVRTLLPGELTSVVTQVAEAFIEGDKAGV